MAKDLTNASLTQIESSPWCEKIYVPVQRALWPEDGGLSGSCLHSSGALMLDGEKLVGGLCWEERPQLGLHSQSGQVVLRELGVKG